MGLFKRNTRDTRVEESPDSENKEVPDPSQRRSRDSGPGRDSELEPPSWITFQCREWFTDADY